MSTSNLPVYARYGFESMADFAAVLAKDPDYLSKHGHASLPSPVQGKPGKEDWKEPARPVYERYGFRSTEAFADVLARDPGYLAAHAAAPAELESTPVVLVDF